MGAFAREGIGWCLVTNLGTFWGKVRSEVPETDEHYCMKILTYVDEAKVVRVYLDRSKCKK